MNYQIIVPMFLRRTFMTIISIVLTIWIICHYIDFVHGMKKHLWVNLNENVWKGYTSLNLIFGWKKVKKPFIIRIPTFPNYSEDYYYSLLVLLLPHRSENELIMPYSSAKDSFINKRCLLNSSIDFTYFSFTEQIENTIRRLNLEEDLNNSTFNVEETESVHFQHREENQREQLRSAD